MEWTSGLRPANVRPKDDASLALRGSDVQLGSDHAQITIRIAKNSTVHSQDRRRISSYADATIDPVRWLRILLQDAQIRGRDTLLPPGLQKEIDSILRSQSNKSGLRLTEYSTRIGHVTHAMSAGVPMGVILREQGWAQERSLMTYERIDQATSRMLATRMSNQTAEPTQPNNLSTRIQPNPLTARGTLPTTTSSAGGGALPARL